MKHWLFLFAFPCVAIAHPENVDTDKLIECNSSGCEYEHRHDEIAPYIVTVSTDTRCLIGEWSYSVMPYKEPKWICASSETVKLHTLGPFDTNMGASWQWSCDDGRDCDWLYDLAEALNQAHERWEQEPLEVISSSTCIRRTPGTYYIEIPCDPFSGLPCE